MESTKIDRALISVSDKTGIAEFARGLNECGIEILSTGGTAKHLAENGIPVLDVSKFTGFAEIMDGRVKTLHPKIFAGILARRDKARDVQVMAELGFPMIDLVVVNLYPFAETISDKNVDLQKAIEMIDIGGPSLIRAAAKNFHSITIATDPSQYTEVLEAIRSSGGTSLELRANLMRAAFRHTAIYDSTIADFFAEDVQSSAELPASICLHLTKRHRLRYGENNHQAAAVYAQLEPGNINLIDARQLNGKELSFNNLLDMDSALHIVKSFEEPVCCVIKHNNPCGVATHKDIAVACEMAFASDSVSAFGSVVGMNRQLDESTAEFLCGSKLFVEAIVASSFSEGALATLKTKPKWRENVRLVATGPLLNDQNGLEFRQVHGGFLAQQRDWLEEEECWKVVTRTQPNPETLAQLKFTWNVCRHVKSNAIVLAANFATVGIGAGQMSRVDSVEIAIAKAGERARGSVLASDAFFPFGDSIERAGQAGVSAIIQPGGSIKDNEVISACNEFGIAMIFTGHRHFRH
ncbi:MAG TPA: bifunctional phosphoribosylaminoimidazolecarboxamide formyltransferase/IMP cyclohydrolase [Pirellulaceae bacterium]|nr:bifunctional phosphoribosylaminoimidazolecarboxamide formyltransferase/IMP cyclohydrolase [Pirellulaceae bacterium]HMO93983.1 bifunctional phosphoribosylaminoimidazolecarboxamide formyltransferase/IMP cyclohydrolase [Pirellulaceae bacterium]HMP70861.1 bifunctional phosphoribosylaminoimidazolecarboxamide formyltransferase/IMP cyclohydrolase [Pirellulaceae bacterium]